MKYEDAVRATWEHLKSNPSEWRSLEVVGVDASGGHIYAFPAGYKGADVLFKQGQGEDGMCCELCGHGLKNAFYIVSDYRREIMLLGSECVTHFGAGDSGEKIAKADVRALKEREIARIMQEIRDAQKHIAEIRQGICRAEAMKTFNDRFGYRWARPLDTVLSKGRKLKRPYDRWLALKAGANYLAERGIVINTSDDLFNKK